MYMGRRIIYESSYLVELRVSTHIYGRWNDTRVQLQWRVEGPMLNVIPKSRNTPSNGAPPRCCCCSAVSSSSLMPPQSHPHGATLLPVPSESLIFFTVFYRHKTSTSFQRMYIIKHRSKGYQNGRVLGIQKKKGLPTTNICEDDPLHTKANSNLLTVDWLFRWDYG